MIGDRLDFVFEHVPSAVERLRLIFPHEGGVGDTRDDFGEESFYRSESALSYAFEHDVLFGPMLKLYDLARRIGTAISYEMGAIG